jgi:hypothetical protein
MEGRDSLDSGARLIRLQYCHEFQGGSTYRILRIGTSDIWRLNERYPSVNRRFREKIGSRNHKGI